MLAKRGGGPAKSRGRVGPKKRQEKAGRFSVSFDPKLNKQVRAAAGDNISAWLAQAARERLRLEAAAEFVREYEDRKGKLSDELMAEVEREWPR